MTTEQQIAEKEDLLTEMILLSARPTTSWVSAALKMVWQRSEVENIDRFAKAMTSCSQFCFQKSLQASTGSKLSPNCADYSSKQYKTFVNWGKNQKKSQEGFLTAISS